MRKTLLAVLLIIGLPNTALADQPSPEAILEQALAAARTIDHAKAHAIILAEIAAVARMNGDPTAAKALFQESVEIAVSLDAWRRDSVLKAIATLQAGSWHGAFGAPFGAETLAGVKLFMERNGTAGGRGLSGADSAAYDIEGALAAARMIGDVEDRLWALWFIARRAIDSGNEMNLAPLIEDALKTARLHENAETRAEVLAVIAWLQVLAGDRSASEQTFGEALAIAASLKSDSERAEALRYSAAARLATGNRPAAERAIEESLALAKPAGELETLQKIASWQARTGDIEGALTTARAIGDPQGLACAALAYMTAGNRTAAAETLREAREAITRAGPLAASEEERPARAHGRRGAGRESDPACVAILSRRDLCLAVQERGGSRRDRRRSAQGGAEMSSA